MSSTSRVYEVYVEDVASTKYICLHNQKLIHVKKPLSIPLNICEKLYGEIPYERVLEFIDLENAMLRKGILILDEDPSLPEFPGFLIEKNAQLCLQEIRGKFIYFLVGEGSQIKRGDVIAYHVTGKFEVRNVRSKCEGQIALIVDMPWETPRKSLVVVTSEYRRVTVEKSA